MGYSYINTTLQYDNNIIKKNYVKTMFLLCLKKNIKQYNNNFS